LRKLLLLVSHFLAHFAEIFVPSAMTMQHYQHPKLSCSSGEAISGKMLHRWTRLSSIKWEDAWAERLRFLGPEKIVFVTWNGSHALKIEAYCDERTAKELATRFGGRVTKLPAHVWSGDPARPRGPVSIRGKLKIFSDRPSWLQWRKAGQKPNGIFVPAGMAFGTGEHATTATCLRLLADIAGKLPLGFTALDLGTGAGILAIAAAAFGAGRVEAIDYDPVAVRIAKENASTNRLSNVEVARCNVLNLTVRRPFDVVLANLFSDVLIAAAPCIARATKSGGRLIFSGVLREQAPEVAGAFEAEGFSNSRTTTRGKWCAAICQRI
jgi:ribosomal protein L11 methyltransferase